MPSHGPRRLVVRRFEVHRYDDEGRPLVVDGCYQVAHMEELACGHVVEASEDALGPTYREQRRCIRCYELKQHQARDNRGRYDYDGDMSRLCRCGYPLGRHAAENPTGKRPCFACEPDCPSFRLRR